MKIISKRDLAEKVAGTASGCFLLDVREREEYEAGHIPTAISMPWHTVTERIAGMRTDAELIAYCETNVRAARAVDDLERLGYENVSLYRGGWTEWSRAMN